MIEEDNRIEEKVYLEGGPRLGGGVSGVLKV